MDISITRELSGITTPYPWLPGNTAVIPGHEGRHRHVQRGAARRRGDAAPARQVRADARPRRVSPCRNATSAAPQRASHEISRFL
jgi:hypothetical protein